MTIEKNGDRKASFARTGIALATVLAFTGCAANREHTQGIELVKQGQPVKGLESLRRASELDPSNVRFQVDYLDKKQETIRNLLTRASTFVEAGALDEAWQAYQDTLGLEPHNELALRGLKRIEAERRAEQQLGNADRLLLANKPDQALDLASQVLRELPQNLRADQLRRSAEDKIQAEKQARDERLATHAAFRRPVSLTFRDTPLKLIFEALSRAANINVVVDREVKSDVKTTIFVKDAPIEDAIDVLLLQNQLDKRILNGNSILVFPATAAKQKEFAELKVRSFQLSNIDAALMANIVKTMVKTKDIVTDPKTNILVMRDTAEAIALAERLVAANDVPDAEVMLEVNVLEVASNRTNELGVKIPTTATFGTPTTGADGSTWTISDLSALKRAQVRVSPITATLNLLMQDGTTQLLASPHIRARNKEKARILVGDKLPQITNVLSATTPTAQNASGYSALTGSIQYIDVGIKLDVEPEVYTDGDVGIKLMLEVSNVTGTMATQSGTAYQIGTRSAQTNLRLHDGETQILGGLIRNSDSDAAQKIPGIGQLPMVGRLFSNHKAEGAKTEIIVSITPHIIRPRANPELRYSDAWSGTDSTIRDRTLRLDSIGAMKLTQPRAEPTVAERPPAATLQPAPRPVSPAPAAVPLVAPVASPRPVATPTAPMYPSPVPRAMPQSAQRPPTYSPTSSSPGAATPDVPPPSESPGSDQTNEPGPTPKP